MLHPPLLPRSCPTGEVSRRSFFAGRGTGATMSDGRDFAERTGWPPLHPAPSTRRFPAFLPSAPPRLAATTSSRPAQTAGSSPASCTPSSTVQNSSSRSSSTRPVSPRVVGTDPLAVVFPVETGGFT